MSQHATFRMPVNQKLGHARKRMELQIWDGVGVHRCTQETWGDGRMRNLENETLS